jgi:Asp-tRNA(Asn)/Glu-tRNA(Gln) amidotransferase B subunit
MVPLRQFAEQLRHPVERQALEAEAGRCILRRTKSWNGGGGLAEKTKRKNSE